MNITAPRRTSGSGFLPEIASAIVAVYAALFVAGTALRRGFPVDDAWIHMVYGLSLRRGQGFAYNDGLAATGSTSPLWSLVAALAHVVTRSDRPSFAAATALKYFGVASFAAGAALAARLAKIAVPRARNRPFAGIVAGTTVATCPILAFAAVSGMEVALASALMLGALVEATRRRPLWAGILAGLAALARPEAMLAIPIVAALVAVGARATGSTGKALLVGAVRVIGPATAIVVLSLTRNVLVSGRPFPATFYRKSRIHILTIGDDLLNGYGEILGHLRPTSSPVFWVLVLFAILVGILGVQQIVPRRSSELAWRRIVSGSTALLGVVYVTAISVMIPMTASGVFYFERYVLPAVPLLVTGAAAMAASLMDGRIISAAFGSWRGVASLAARAAVGAGATLLIVFQVSDWKRTAARYTSNVGDIDAVQIAMGEFVRKTVPPQKVVWTQDAGAIRYFGQRPTVDLDRLNTPELFHGDVIDVEWAAETIIVSPGALGIVAPAGLLEEAFVAHSPSDVGNALGVQIAYRCRVASPAIDDPVFIERHGRQIGVGRCAR